LKTLLLVSALLPGTPGSSASSVSYGSRVTGRKSYLEQIWSALPQTTDIDSSREDFQSGTAAAISSKHRANQLALL